MTVQGHIPGKDGIYAAALLVEMIAVTGRRLSETLEDVLAKTGRLYAAEADFRFTPGKKAEILSLIMREKKLPGFPLKVSDVSYLDGCKIRFENGAWLSVRFSGTEPLLRLTGETGSQDLSDELCGLMKAFIGV
jgi:phosphomannomutase